MKTLNRLIQRYTLANGELSPKIPIDDAWQVVSVLKKDGAFIEVGEIPDGWVCSVWTKNSDLVLETKPQENAPLAIIRAALRYYKIPGFHEAE